MHSLAQTVAGEPAPLGSVPSKREVHPLVAIEGSDAEPHTPAFAQDAMGPAAERAAVHGALAMALTVVDTVAALRPGSGSGPHRPRRRHPGGGDGPGRGRRTGAAVRPVPAGPRTRTPTSARTHTRSSTPASSSTCAHTRCAASAPGSAVRAGVGCRTGNPRIPSAGP